MTVNEITLKYNEVKSNLTLLRADPKAQDVNTRLYERGICNSLFRVKYIDWLTGDRNLLRGFLNADELQYHDIINQALQF